MLRHKKRLTLFSDFFKALGRRRWKNNLGGDPLNKREAQGIID